MSECNRYEYRQPVEIRYGSKWFKGVVTAFDGCDSECPVCVRWLNQNGTSCSDWPTLDEIRSARVWRAAHGTAAAAILAGCLPDPAAWVAAACAAILAANAYATR